MAVIPMLLDIAEELSSPLADEFGLGIYPRNLLQFDYHPLHRLRLLPKNRKSPYTLKKINRNNKIRHIGKDGFQISVDVQQFKPNEITVKTVENTVVIEGKHEEREDEHGIISRHFLRKYTLPKDYDPNAVTSTLSSDGILTVKAPPPPEKKVKSIERVIEIQQTGPACDSIKDNRKSEEENGSNGAVEK